MTYTELFTTFYQEQVGRVLSTRAFIRSHFLAAIPESNRAQAEKICGDYGSNSGAKRKQVEAALAGEYTVFLERLYEYETVNTQNMLRCFYDVPGLNTGAVLQAVEQKDPQLAEQLRLTVVTIDDVPRLDDRLLQKVLREITEKDCAKALLGADPAVQNKVFSNMSKRAAAQLQELMNKMNATDSEIRAAQQVLVKIMVRLVNDGEIVINRRIE